MFDFSAVIGGLWVALYQPNRWVWINPDIYRTEGLPYRGFTVRRAHCTEGLLYRDWQLQSVIEAAGDLLRAPTCTELQGISDVRSWSYCWSMVPVWVLLVPMSRDSDTARFIVVRFCNGVWGRWHNCYLNILLLYIISIKVITYIYQWYDIQYHTRCVYDICSDTARQSLSQEVTKQPEPRQQQLTLLTSRLSNSCFVMYQFPTTGKGKDSMTPFMLAHHEIIVKGWVVWCSVSTPVPHI